MSVKLLTEHHLEFLSLNGGCTGLSESTHDQMPHCWKSHVAAQFILDILRKVSRKSIERLCVRLKHCCGCLKDIQHQTIELVDLNHISIFCLTRSLSLIGIGVIWLLSLVCFLLRITTSVLPYYMIIVRSPNLHKNIYM